MSKLLGRLGGASDSPDPVETFMHRVRQANASGSREVRMSMQEATDLATAMGALMARALSAAPAVAQMRVDGGRV